MGDQPSAQSTRRYDDEALDRANEALCRFLFPGYVVPRSEMARAVAIALEGAEDSASTPTSAPSSHRRWGDTMSDGWAIFDSGPGALHRHLHRMLAPPPRPLRIVTDQYKGDPFLTLIESNGQHYVFNEAALIEDEERMIRDWRFLDG